MTRKTFFRISAAAVVAGPCLAQQDELTVIAPGGARAFLEQLGPAFTKVSGMRVNLKIGTGLGTKKQVVQGEPFDLAILQPPFPEVIASGQVIASGNLPLASVAVGLAVRKGTRKPDISTVDKTRLLLLEARSIAYPDPTAGAAAGVSFDAMLKQLGIWDAVAPKLRRAQGGAGAMAMTARGEAEIGITFLSEMQDPGIEVVGPLPEAICPPTQLVGLVGAHTKNTAAAKRLLEFLAAPAAAEVYRSAGMQPAR